MRKLGSWSASSSAFLPLLVVCCLCIKTVEGVYMNYNTGAKTVPGKLNVHLVPHSHDDVGWLKTVDQYYVGTNSSIQAACVQNVLDSVVDALWRDPNRKFVFTEMAFFQRWWREQNPRIQELVKKLVDGGQLEFVNGGWCMHDEATTHYIDMIDQSTLGHRLIKELFNKAPRAGWQIDAFGHSAVQAYLLAAELGFDSVHFARIDYQDREHRKTDKSLEVIWRGSKTFGSSSQIFANAFPENYSPPTGFSFAIDDFKTEIFQDDPLLFDYNVDDRVNDFINTAKDQANFTRTNHIMWTMGDDFEYKYAETWFRQMDKLIHYVNKDGQVNALYSTPSMYTDAKNAANESWPLKKNDFFPYADVANAYWTGYFSSRPAFKWFVRSLSGYYLAARQLEFWVGKRSNGPNTYSLGEALATAQHHDAITGTAKQHTTDDYTKRLAIGLTEAKSVVSSALSCLTKNISGDKCEEPASAFSQCQLLNISYCPPTENGIPDGMSLVVVTYNSLAWNRTDIVRVPVNDADLIVQDSFGVTIDRQYIDLDNVTRSVRDLHVKAYLGHSPNTVPKYWLLFQAYVPALGWNTYFITKGTQKEHDKGRRLETSRENETEEIGNGNLKMYFSTKSGQLQRMHNIKAGVDLPVQQSYLWYASSSNFQSSGAYIFLPDNNPPTIVSQSGLSKVIRGPLVDEVHQQFSQWIYQVTRLYKDKEHAEIEFTIGPISTDTVGMEVITRMTTNMATKKVFYTDSNGRDFLKRVRNFREDWNFTVDGPVAGNYYPINLGIYTMDEKYEFSVLVDRATGGSSIHDGEIELMLHRRISSDDARGVGEPLQENVCLGDKCVGLTIRGHYYVSINKMGEGAHWRRTIGQEVYSPLLLAFAYEKKETWMASHMTNGTAMDPDYTLPLNVALITLQELEDGSVLLRLAHLYEEGEDTTYSTLAKVELKKMFNGRTIKEVKETSLTTNQVKSEMKKLKWKVEGDDGKEHSPVRGGPLNDSTLVVELGPMEIRTFILKL